MIIYAPSRPEELESSPESFQIDSLEVLHEDGSRDIVISGDENLNERKFVYLGDDLSAFKSFDIPSELAFNLKRDNIVISAKGVVFFKDGSKDTFTLELSWTYYESLRWNSRIVYRGE